MACENAPQKGKQDKSCETENNNDLKKFPNSFKEVIQKNLDGSKNQISQFEDWKLTAEQIDRLTAKVAGAVDASKKVELNFAHNIHAGVTYLAQMVAHELVEESNKADIDGTPVHENHEFALSLHTLYGGSFFPLDDITDATTARSSGGSHPEDDREIKIEILNNKDGKTQPKENEGRDTDCPDNQPKANQPIGLDFNRCANNIAQTPDRRNDTNRILSQLCCFWLNVHNQVFEKALGSGARPVRAFYMARAVVTLYFQYAVKNEFLKAVLHPKVFDLYFNDTAYSDFILEDQDKAPIEFSNAVFRFGHSMVRQFYRFQTGGEALSLSDIFKRKNPLQNNEIISWEQFFPIDEENPPQKASMINLHFVKGLLSVPEVGDVKEEMAVQVSAINAMKKPLANLNFNFHQKLAETEASSEADLRKMCEELAGLICKYLEEQSKKGSAKIGHDGTVNMVERDLCAASECISGGDLVRLVYRFDDGNLLGKLDERTGSDAEEEYLEQMAFRSISPSSAADIRMILDTDVIPLNLFTLAEASQYPYWTSKKNKEEVDYQQYDKLGLISSIVIAEAVRLAMKKSYVNIFDWEDKIKKHLKGLDLELKLLEGEVNTSDMPPLSVATLMKKYPVK